MKNKHLYLLFGLLMSYCNMTFAQEIVEDFDDITTLKGKGWLIHNKSTSIGLTNWFQGDVDVFRSYNGEKNSYLAANFNNVANGTISNWLVSPKRTFKNGDVITFFTRKENPDIYADRLEVRLSTNGDGTEIESDSSVGDFTNLLLSINPDLKLSIYPTDWKQYTITISGLSEPVSGHIAFRYFVTNAGIDGANSDYIGIDAFRYIPFNCPNLGAPEGDSTQRFNSGEDLTAFIARGQNIKWYPTLNDAINHTNELPKTTKIVHNTTYYATQSIDSCESNSALAVLAQNESLAVLNTTKMKASIYPNPAKDIISINGIDQVEKIIIFGLDGRKIKEESSVSNTIDVSNLMKGSYILQVISSKGIQSFKFIKL